MMKMLRMMVMVRGIKCGDMERRMMKRRVI
jgi:hypothetical protein